MVGHEQVLYYLGSLHSIGGFFHNHFVFIRSAAIFAGFLAGLEYQFVKMDKLDVRAIVGQVLAMLSAVGTSCGTSVAGSDAMVPELPVGLVAVVLHGGTCQREFRMVLAGDFLRRFNLDVTDEYLILLETNVGRCCCWLSYGDVGLCLTGTFGI